MDRSEFLSVLEEFAVSTLKNESATEAQVTAAAAIAVALLEMT